MTSLSEPREPRKSSKPRRGIRWLGRALDAFRRYGTVQITVGTTATVYDVRELDGGPDGRGFELTKVPALPGEEPYHVWLSMTNPQDRTCECKGFLRHGHCKHTAGLAALLAHQDAAERDAWEATITAATRAA
jgi:hypothetical protein